MNRLVLSFVVALFIQTAASAQVITLQQAIDTALAKNIQVKQNRLLVDVAQVNWNQSRFNQLPDLAATMNHGINQGRSIDPFTNQYVNQSISYAGYGLSSGIVLFNGLSLKNNVKQNQYSFEASEMELQQAKDNLVLNVILAYLVVLNNEDQLSSALKQAELSQKQMERLEILDKQGAISPAQVSDLRGQLMNDQLSITTLKGQVESAKLSLAQLMNVPYTPAMEVERISVQEYLNPYSRTATQIYTNALDQFALVKSVELRKKAADYALKSTKGELYPSLILGGNMQTNYSSVAQNAAGKISYNDQLKNNIFSTINLGIRVPIFNQRLTRNRIKLADIEVKRNELVEENTKVQLKQQVEQAYLNMSNAYDRYKILIDQVKAYEESFHAAEAKFNAGLGTSVDFLTAKNNLDRANINLISAQYDFVLRKKILDYYNGK
jgi:outer membrane protein